jgi:hypothetical protein
MAADMAPPFSESWTLKYKGRTFLVEMKIKPCAFYCAKDAKCIKCVTSILRHKKTIKSNLTFLFPGCARAQELVRRYRQAVAQKTRAVIDSQLPSTGKIPKFCYSGTMVKSEVFSVNQVSLNNNL